MQLTLNMVSRSMRKGSRLYRPAIWLLAAILTLQVFASAFHNHDLATEHSDCVSCYFVAHFPSPISPVTIDLSPNVAHFQYQILEFPAYVFLATPSFLIPLSQGPPVLRPFI
jgi:hypothetical protein